MGCNLVAKLSNFLSTARPGGSVSVSRLMYGLSLAMEDERNQRNGFNLAPLKGLIDQSVIAVSTTRL